MCTQRGICHFNKSDRAVKGVKLRAAVPLFRGRLTEQLRHRAADGKDSRPGAAPAGGVGKDERGRERLAKPANSARRRALPERRHEDAQPRSPGAAKENYCKSDQLRAAPRLR